MTLVADATLQPIAVFDIGSVNQPDLSERGYVFAADYQVVCLSF